MQVHDALVFAMRSHGDPVKENEQVKKANGKAVFRTSNLWRVRVLQKLMESCGDSINVPTPVSVEYHDTSWDVGVQL